MRIAVLGAGVIGVATAWQLLKDGHEVMVVDKADGPATFTSFGNAGLVAPGHSYAWSSPAAPAMMLRSMWRNDSAIRFKPKLSISQWRWIGKFLGQCNVNSATVNTANKSRLCIYSQIMLNEVVADTGVKYDGLDGGLIYFYRTPAAFDAAIARSQILRENGLQIEVLDREQTIAKDSGLEPAAGQIAGSLFVPSDASGDSNLFAIALAKKCAAAGCTFRYGEEIAGVRTANSQVTAIVTSNGEISTDAYVLCLGVYSPHLAAKLKLDLPIYPVKGYSATLRVTNRDMMPRIGGVDEENLLAYCPMGDRLRITATAEIAEYSTDHKPSDFRAMLSRAKALFGDSADFDEPQYWAGLRPMTPTGLPIIDRSPYENFWINTGHGHMGWTMSNGSARILADLVAQKQPAISQEGMYYEA